jgi:hypothetical protein
MVDAPSVPHVLDCLNTVAEVGRISPENILKMEIDLQTYSQGVRHKVFTLFQKVDFDENVLQRFISLIDGEKDPRNLLLVFKTCYSILKGASFPRKLISQLHDVTFCYFPITFKNKTDDNIESLKNDLCSLASCNYEYFRLSYPILLDKLEHASSDLVKRDCLQVLERYFRSKDSVLGNQDEQEFMGKQLSALYLILKREAIHSKSPETCMASYLVLEAIVKSLSQSAGISSSLTRFLDFTVGDLLNELGIRENDSTVLNTKSVLHVAHFFRFLTFKNCDSFRYVFNLAMPSILKNMNLNPNVLLDVANSLLTVLVELDGFKIDQSESFNDLYELLMTLHFSVEDDQTLVNICRALFLLLKSKAINKIDSVLEFFGVVFFEKKLDVIGKYFDEISLVFDILPFIKSKVERYGLNNERMMVLIKELTSSNDLALNILMLITSSEISEFSLLSTVALNVKKASKDVIFRVINSCRNADGVYTVLAHLMRVNTEQDAVVLILLEEFDLLRDSLIFSAVLGNYKSVERIPQTLFDNLRSLSSYDKYLVTLVASFVNKVDGFEVKLDKNIDLMKWCGKAYVLNGNSRGPEIFRDLLRILDTNMSDKEAVCGCFSVVYQDGDDCLSKASFARIKPLYKQKFLKQILPELIESFQRCQPENKQFYLIALANLVHNLPEHLLIQEISRIGPLVIHALDCKNEEALSTILDLLILITERAPQIIKEHLEKIINSLIRLSVESTMMIRMKSVKGMTSLSRLEYSSIFPFKERVIRSLGNNLSDKKRLVRQEAVKCRTKWYLSQ